MRGRRPLSMMVVMLRDGWIGRNDKDRQYQASLLPSVLPNLLHDDCSPTRPIHTMPARRTTRSKKNPFSPANEIANLLSKFAGRERANALQLHRLRARICGNAKSF